jgi:hypothetical protein
LRKTAITPTLPEAIRASILAIIEAASKPQ